MNLLHSADHVGKDLPIATDALRNDRLVKRINKVVGKKMACMHLGNCFRSSMWICRLSMVSPWDPYCWRPASARACCLKIWKFCSVASWANLWQILFQKMHVRSRLSSFDCHDIPNPSDFTSRLYDEELLVEKTSFEGLVAVESSVEVKLKLRPLHCPFVTYVN